MTFSSHSFPPPPPDPLKRLHVYDGLMMNARRWALADGYHRRRQNLHYQALYQPGIVCGLGVRVIEPPDSVESKFRDRRWLQIQPGVAIDFEGNPIIVDLDTDRCYRIDAKPSGDNSLTVYIVASYAEPRIPAGQATTETLREWFRFDQITHPPHPHQVELCRILLKEPVSLENPSDVLTPLANQLDFRYRPLAQTRSHAYIRVAQVQPTDNFIESSDFSTYTLYQRRLANLSELVASAFSLCSTLSGEVVKRPISLETEELVDYDLLYLPDGYGVNEITQAGFAKLNQYLQAGGGLLIECSPTLGRSPELVKNRLSVALAESDPTEPEWTSWTDLPRNHLLHRIPFVFGSLPEEGLNQLYLGAGGSVLLLDGNLSLAWGLSESAFLPRVSIRSAQEFGINILYYFWQRRQWINLQQWEDTQFLSVVDNAK